MASTEKVSANYRQDDYQALLWMAEAWSDEPLPHLGVVADPADDPERARSEAEGRMSEIRLEASGVDKPCFTVDYRPIDNEFPYAVVPLTGKEIYREIPWCSFSEAQDARNFADTLNARAASKS